MRVAAEQSGSIGAGGGESGGLEKPAAVLGRRPRVEPQPRGDRLVQHPHSAAKRPAAGAGFARDTPDEASAQSCGGAGDPGRVDATGIEPIGQEGLFADRAQPEEGDHPGGLILLALQEHGAFARGALHFGDGLEGGDFGRDQAGRQGAGLGEIPTDRGRKAAARHQGADRFGRGVSGQSVHLCKVLPSTTFCPLLSKSRTDEIRMGPIKRADGIADVVLGRSPIEWSDLRIFLAIAQTGSLTRAAKALHITQPTVSRRLEALELGLGVQLAYRSDDGVALTAAGKLVADRALTMQRTAAAIETAIAQAESEPAGEVLLSAPGGLAAYWIAPALAELQRSSPKIRVRHTNIAASEADVRVSFAEAKKMEDVAVGLGWVHYVAFASAEYLDLYGMPQNLFEGLQHRVLTHGEYQHQTDRWDEDARPVYGALKPSLITDDSAALLNAAASGAGIAIMPSYAAKIEPRLVMLESVPVLAKVRFWAIFDRERGDVPRVRRVIDWLRRTFEPLRNPWFREEFVPPSQF